MSKRNILIGLGIALGVLTLAPTYTYLRREVDNNFLFHQTIPGITTTAGLSTDSIQSTTIDTAIDTTWNSTTNPGTSTLTGTLPVAAQLKIDYSMANATDVPVFSSEGGIGGICGPTGTHFNFTAYYINAQGITGTGPLLDYTMVGTNKNVFMNKPATGTPPSATQWRMAWSSAGAPSTLWWCASNPSALGSTQQCDCKTTHSQPTGVNSTSAIGIARIWDGKMDFATLLGGVPTQGRTVLKTGVDGAIGVSFDAGSTFNNLLTTASNVDPLTRIPGGSAPISGAVPEVVNICPSGCTYSSLTSACSGRGPSSTATTPIVFHVGAGLYTSATGFSCNFSYGAIVGDGIGQTILDATSGTNQGALVVSGSHDILISGMTLRATAPIRWINSAGSGVGISVIKGVEMDPSADTTSATDCLYLAESSDNSILRMENNRCIGSWFDGFTVGTTNGKITVLSIGNHFYYPAGYATMGTTAVRMSAWYLLAPIQSFYSLDDVVDWTAAASSIGGEIANQGFTGFLFSPNATTGFSGGTAIIKNPTIRITNNGDDTSLRRATGIAIGSGTTDWGRIDVMGGTIDINVPTATTNGTSEGIDDFDAQIPVNIIGTRIRTAGGASANRFDLKGTTAGNIKVVGSDFLLADYSSAAIVTGFLGNLATAPAKCNVGDTYIDTTGGAVASCLCTAANTWTAVGGTGTCA